MGKKILISGANYRNKGAQSMLFVSIEELKKRMPDCEIYFGCLWEDSKITGVSFHQINYAKEVRRIIAGKKVLYNLIISTIKAVRSMFQRKYTNIFNYLEAFAYIKKMDMILDVSGFAIGDKWGERIHAGVLDSIRIGEKYNIPVYLMPQSFGPFNYSPEKAYIKEDVQKWLPRATKIFAREYEGFKFLTDEFGLKNVILSTDMVLQAKEINVEYIYNEMPNCRIPDFTSEHNVGIVPNVKLFEHGNKEKIMGIYCDIIDTLLKANRDVFLFRHSAEDLRIIEEIGKLYDTNNHVHVLKDNFSCIEFEQLIKKFDFIICSRFHGVVHAYRHFVPVLILGWAVKYVELANSVKQSQYVFDITNEQCAKNEIMFALDKLISGAHIDSEIIKQNMEKLQKDNCFDNLFDEKLSV